MDKPLVTNEALRMLAAIRECGMMPPEAYEALVREAERIRRERKAFWLGRVHLEEAMDNLAEASR